MSKDNRQLRMKETAMSIPKDDDSQESLTSPEDVPISGADDLATRERLRQLDAEYRNNRTSLPPLRATLNAIHDSERRKKVIARVVAVVGITIFLLCVAMVCVTLKMSPKIDEMVRSKNSAEAAEQSRASGSKSTTLKLLTTISTKSTNLTLIATTKQMDWNS